MGTRSRRFWAGLGQGVAITVVLALSIAVTIGLFPTQLKLLTHSETVEGVITSNPTRESCGESDCSRAVVRFVTTAGTTHSKRMTVGGDDGVGDVLSVHYPADDPSGATTDGRFGVIGAFVLIVLLGPGMLIAFVYDTLRRVWKAIRGLGEEQNEPQPQ